MRSILAQCCKAGLVRLALLVGGGVCESIVLALHLMGAVFLFVFAVVWEGSGCSASSSSVRCRLFRLFRRTGS